MAVEEIETFETEAQRSYRLAREASNFLKLNGFTIWGIDKAHSGDVYIQGVFEARMLKGAYSRSSERRQR